MKWHRIAGVAGKLLDVGVKAAFIRAHLPLMLIHLVCTALAFIFIVVALFVDGREQALLLGLAAVAMLAAVLMSVAMLWLMVAAFIERKL